MGMKVAGAALLLLAACTAAADVVHLKNGDRITGKVDSLAGGNVLIDTEYAGSVLIALDSVANVETDEAFEVRLEDGSVVSGAFMASADEQALVVAADGTGVAAAERQVVPVTLAAVRSAGQERNRFVGFSPDWTSRVDLAMELSTGNAETERYNTFMETRLKRERVSHDLSVQISQERADGERVKDQLDFDYNFKSFFAQRWYGSGNLEYFQDEFKEVDYRVTAGAGIGHQFWDDSFGALSTDLGVSAVVEGLDGEYESNPALRWAVDYNRYLFSKRLEFFHGHALLVIPDADRGSVLQTSTGLRLMVNDHLDTALRVDVRHETEPPDETADRTDTTYSLGVGVRF